MQSEVGSVQLLTHSENFSENVRERVREFGSEGAREVGRMDG